MQTESEHRVVKRRWGQTNKRAAVGQIVERDIIERVHDRMAEELEEAYAHSDSASESDDDSSLSDLSAQVRIATDESSKIYLPTWLKDPRQDPAFKVMFYL